MLVIERPPPSVMVHLALCLLKEKETSTLVRSKCGSNIMPNGITMVQRPGVEGRTDILQGLVCCELKVIMHEFLIHVVGAEALSVHIAAGNSRDELSASRRRYIESLGAH